MKNKLYFIIVATLLCPTSLYAQSGTDKRSVLSFQTGPTLYTGKLIGIAGYSSNLRNGIGWSGSYTYLVGNKPASQHRCRCQARRIRTVPAAAQRNL